MYEQRNTKRLIIALVTCVLLAAGWFGANYANHHGKTKVTVYAVPSDSTVKLNGSPIGTGVIYLKPGHYTFEASRQDFGSVKSSIDVQQNGRPQTIYLLPIPNTAAAIEFLNQHPEIQQQRERLGGVNSESNQTALAQKYPIISKLPAYTAHYRIDYSLDSKQQISFAVTLYAISNNPNQYQQYVQQLQQYKAEALQFLTSNGIDTSKVLITYTPSI
ncbi:MAG TPA: hypothetical protein VFI84_04675 [Candidatus Saccharimonadales bacterium]|nr:hypothetical protein [Candidatus Saccharimonadales bacterium]